MSYRVGYVPAAVGAVVAIVLAAVAIDPSGEKSIYVAVAAPVLLAAGILAYQRRWASSQAAPHLPQAPARAGERQGHIRRAKGRPRQRLAVGPLAL